MSRLEQYAQWLVDNEDKKGTPDFDTVANAYRSLRTGIQSPKVEEPSKERTWGEAVKDLGASMTSGVGSLTQLPGQIYGLATGDFSDTGLLREGRLIQKHAENLKSEGLKAREAAREEAIRKAREEGGEWGAFKTAFGETVTDPALLASFTAEQVPNILPSILQAALQERLHLQAYWAKLPHEVCPKKPQKKLHKKPQSKRVQPPPFRPVQYSKAQTLAPARTT